MEILSVLLAAIASFGAGAAYYMTFSKQWMQASGVTQEYVDSGDKTPFVIGFITAIISAGMMRHILTMSGIATLGKAALVGAGIGAFIVGAWIFLGNAYEGKPLKLSVINTGYAIIALAIQGVILTLM